MRRGAETYGTVVALAESYVKPGLLFAGTDDGNVWMSHNDGAIVGEPHGPHSPACPTTKSYVNRIEPSHFDTLTFWVAVRQSPAQRFHAVPLCHERRRQDVQVRSRTTCRRDGVGDFVHVIREDPHNRDLLFVGTSISAYASIDRGTTLEQFAGEPAIGAGLRSEDPSARSRADCRDARPRLLDRRHRAARADDAEDARFGTRISSSRRRRYQWGEGPALSRSGNGNAQASSRCQARRTARRFRTA